MDRSYSLIIKEHFKHYRQMVFIAGPRQVGKTTLCQGIGTDYINWDNQRHRQLIIKGPESVANELGLNLLQEKERILVFDEIHKYSRWKVFLKGFFDMYSMHVKIIVTGSSRLDIYQKGGDSLFQ